MSSGRLLLFLLLLSQLGGCASIVARSGEVVPTVDRLIDEQEYGRALTILDLVDKNHPDYQQLAQRRKRIARGARVLERTTIERAEALVTADEWGQALELYEVALDRLPNSEPLKSGLQRLKAEQSRRISDLEQKELLHHARWLLASLPLDESRTRTNPQSYRYQWILAQRREEGEEVADKLTTRAEEALKQEQLNLADRLIGLALKLPHDARTDEVGTAVRQQAQKERSRKARRHAAMRQEEIARLTHAYREAFTQQQWLEARKLLNELAALKAAETEEMSKALESRIATTVEEDFSAGVSLYSQGQYEQAVSHWQRVLQLEPGHQRARENLRRAERVIGNLERLREQSSL